MKNLSYKDYLLVVLQGVLFVMYIIDLEILHIKLLSIITIIGLLIAIAGILIFLLAILQLSKNLSPFPTPRSDSSLIKNGLYRYVRHPIYTGILMTFYGYAFYSDSIYKILIASLLLILFYVKSRYEESKLKEKFPSYSTYALITGRFLPKLLVKNS
ncbi:hypothetical protein JCM19296_2074 [Nonlabens ulvanivorans]|uniref:Isoprenylcysteine carboxylmethyltransferase family protein n=1 Tax=Nonlabens ulvanivorans TaxID=906888 RepID=A0A081DC31_NONUL|nr:hypothetical protein JCM19296_2074 [Nonlabens ulvanivorans]